MFRLRRKVYLDNNATTAIAPAVVRKMHHVLKHQYGNPSSLYKISYASAELLATSRAEIAGKLHAQPEELFFTGCATESNNQIIHSAFEHHFPSKTTILTTPIEHPSVLSTLEYLKTKGLRVEYVPVDSCGRIKMDAYQAMVDDSCFLVCAMFVNNELGTIQDIRELARIAHAHGALFFSDCVQAFGKIPVDVQELDIDYASFSAHKINGPKGVGALYARTGAPLEPFIHGGHQERGFRAGTEGLHNIAGFAQAVKELPKPGKGSGASSQMDKVMKDFRRGLKSVVSGCVFNTPETDSVSNTLNVTFPGRPNAFLMAFLDIKGISVSAGSACNTPSNDPSHVLTAIGLTEEQARETIRFSLSRKTTASDVRYTLRAISEFVNEKDDSIHMLTPFEFDESLMLNPEMYILDIRTSYERKALRSLPNSHEAEFWKMDRYLKYLPKNKSIVVVCHGGMNSPVIAYYLKKKGFRNLSFIMTGMVGWKLAHPDLYSKYAGTNITHLGTRD
ncbi:MAG: aminotransferase class V-fold PLP-dependent enzyme [Bacteroidota bacterium]